MEVTGLEKLEGCAIEVKKELLAVICLPDTKG